MKKTPKCNKCDSVVTVPELQSEHCKKCNEILDPWKTGFAGDLHEKVGG